MPRSRRRKSTSSRVMDKIRKLTAVKYIQPSFPLFAKTTLVTHAHGKKAMSTSAGFLELDIIKPSSIADPFAAMDITGDDGAVDGDSLLESASKDHLEKIYDSYRVPEVVS